LRFTFIAGPSDLFHHKDTKTPRGSRWWWIFDGWVVKPGDYTRRGRNFTKAVSSFTFSKATSTGMPMEI